MKYRISVGTHNQYEREIAEIDFGKFFTVLISQEREKGKFDVAAVSMKSEQVQLYANGKNDPSDCVPLEVFRTAIDEAIEKLIV